jgi:hypothetical protein
MLQPRSVARGLAAILLLGGVVLCGAAPKKETQKHTGSRWRCGAPLAGGPARARRRALDGEWRVEPPPTDRRPRRQPTASPPPPGAHLFKRVRTARSALSDAVGHVSNCVRSPDGKAAWPMPRGLGPTEKLGADSVGTPA